MSENMIGEARLLDYFKSERERLLAAFASAEQPPNVNDVAALAAFQNAVQATEALIKDGGFKVIGGQKPKTPFWAT